MTSAERRIFDTLLEELLDALPPALLELLEEAPLIVEDQPSPILLRELGMDPETDLDSLCGLHSGSSLFDRTHTGGFDHPETIQLFRRGIIAEAGGWSGPDSRGRIREEIRITLLHEIGHHFGLDEEGLAELGYE